MSQRFTCVSVGFGPLRVTERAAETAEKAAEAQATAMHKAYWVEPYRTGTDLNGSYEEFTVFSGTKVQSTVRVYAEYK